MICRLFSKIRRAENKSSSKCPEENQKPDFISPAGDFERCVMCGALTAVPVSMPIEFREGYQPGCGQLCIACQQKLRKSAEKENATANAQIVRQLENSKKE